MSTNDTILNHIKNILHALEVTYSDVVVTDVAGQTVFKITTEESGKLIGNRGETVRALNHIVKKIAAGSEDEDAAHFMVDVNDYRARALKELQDQALILAGRAKALKYDVEMTPMSSYERMVVHSVLADDNEITTESRGVGRDRKVVIKYTG